MLANFTYFGLYASQRHLAFETGAFDVGVYTQPLWNFIHGRDFAVSIIEDNGPIRWATHVEPILFLIAPLYALWPDPRTLLWLQVAGMSLAALPLYALAARRLHSEWIALVVVLAYFLMPATEAVTLFDFHAVTFAPLFLFSAIYFLERALAGQGVSFWLWPEEQIGESASQRMANTPLSTDQAIASDQGTSSFQSAIRHPPSAILYLLSSIFFLLALSTKEDISLHVFMIGLYLVVLRRRWWEGGLLVVVGLAWFYVTFQVIIPAYRTAGGQSIYAAWFETLGHTPLEIALSPLTKPDQVLALIFRPGSFPALGMITVPLALLPWLGLPLFVLAAPSLAFSLLSQNPTLRQLETWHYAAPMLPFVMLGAIDGLARANYWMSRIKYQLSNEENHASRITYHASRLPPYLFPLLLLITSLTYHNLRGYSPFAQLSEWPEVTPHHQLGRELAATIPGDASVLAQAQLVPYVAHRYKLGIWSGPLLTDYDTIWLDLSHPKFPNRFNAHGDLLTGLTIEPEFGFAAATDGYLLLKKGAPRIPIPAELFTFTQFDRLPAAAQPFEATFGDAFKLVGVKPEVRRLATSETEPQVVLYFEVLQQPSEDYHLFLYLLDSAGQTIGATDYPQPALFWWPTSRWQAGDRRQVRVNTIPWWTGDKSDFAYALGLSRSNDPWDVSARLPVTLGSEANHPAGAQILDGGTLLTLTAFHRFAGLPYPKPLTEIGSK
ncbi:MAG: hypothetical protein BroJett011_65650 [Chloroflexota bacterium]|nr:MAG: hypothetical protein BroJett011_65650 [Chloroflexota bacterium]